MSMTSNSLAERLRLPITALVTCAACASRSSEIAPDSPRPAPQVSWTQPDARAGEQQGRPVEIYSVRLSRVRHDTLLTRLAGAEQIRREPELVAIEVTTTEPLGNVARNASLEVYLDGTRVGDTWPLPPKTLIAFVPNPGRLKAGVSVTVAWFGDEERTRSQRPVTLTEELLRPIR